MLPYDLFLIGAPADGQANPVAMFLPLILIFIVFYFFIIRPQKKKEDQRKQMIEAVKKGDKIVTIGGVHGTVMQVDSNTKLRVEKSAIASIVEKT